MTTDERVRIDPAAVAELYAAHGDELRSFLTGVLRNADLAQEAAQAAFGKLVELGHTAREESLKGWLFRVAYHEAMALRRRQSVEQRSMARLSMQIRQQSKPTEHRVEQNEAVERVRRGLERLPPEQQIVVRKKMFEDKTFAVIAGELGIPLGTVLTRMRTALRNLKQQLKSPD